MYHNLMEVIDLYSFSVSKMIYTTIQYTVRLWIWPTRLEVKVVWHCMYTGPDRMGFDKDELTIQGVRTV